MEVYITMYIKGTELLAYDYANNFQICGPIVDLELNEECYVIDQSIIDEEQGTYMFVPCVVVRVDVSQKIPGRKYYMLQAKDSINDEKFNSSEENGIKFYKYLENTSPFLSKIKEVIEPQNDNAV